MSTDPEITMANGSASSRPPGITAWHRLADPTPQRLALWARGEDRTRWEACGRDWDAVAVHPMANGLDVLDAMGLHLDDGYPVLGDRIGDVLYVLVPPGTAHTAAGLPGVRVLGAGHQLLMPTTGHGTAAAHWISPPPEAQPDFVPSGRFTARLRAASAPDHEKAATS
ncbi:hypothetical protein ACFXAZ_34845 [Streptomyces sp. NPDC059477]|uniref:hypothetical protein n=1 Tax=Streptomyces sp. NPDC059477 TaxID=3346847 RepID=UPI0036881AB9